MATRQKIDEALKRSAVLTLRLSPTEMQRFKQAAVNLGTHRAKLVRERVADLIGTVLPGLTGTDVASSTTNGSVTKGEFAAEVCPAESLTENAGVVPPAGLDDDKPEGQSLPAVAAHVDQP